jgi:putative acetyltransferase
MTASFTVTIAEESADQPEVRAFFAASEAYMSALYPAESNHFTSLDSLLQPNVRFLVARRGTEAVACGAYIVSPAGHAEIKRMWVEPAVRGAGVGRRLLSAIIDGARSDGVRLLQLETGIAQPEAIALYRAAGFVECPPFGDYKPDPLSLFMHLPLTHNEDA